MPSYQPGTEARIEPLSPGEAALRLVACNLNARNLQDGGFELIAALTRRVPAVLFRFGGFSQLKGTLDKIIASSSKIASPSPSCGSLWRSSPMQENPSRFP